MTTQLGSSIARIRATDESVIGAGFLVADRWLLTCAHVVAGALGLPDETAEPAGEKLHLDFPLVAPGHILTARVVIWRPETDIAGLELDDVPPSPAQPARLATAGDLWGHDLRLFGFPHGRDVGVWMRGELLGRNAAGWVQIESKKEIGYFVQPGFSGGPVWDEELDGVVGMIVAADLEPGVRAAFLIPTDVLARAWPEVVSKALLDADMDRLRARQAEADRKRREMRHRRRVVNLRPLDVAHFRNRLREMHTLCDHLADAGVRLISVVGRGGMGKTALASRVLADLERGLKTSEVSETSEVLQVDGILYLSARSTGLGLERIYADVGRMLGEPAATRLADRWGDRDASLAAKVEYLLETMRDEISPDGLYLILLDNLEDYLMEDGTIREEGLRLFIDRCLTQSTTARLVVTSREEMHLTGAALHRARSIPLRDGLPEDQAIALLRDLDPQAMLGLRDAPEDDLRRAAQLTRGIPRALEILAGILHEDPTASLTRLLADERLFGEQVVEQLVAEGYRRLGHDERRIMEALAVFDRPVEETAISYLLHPWFPGLDVRAGLRRLVSGYFAGANRVTGEYGLHPLDREYAYQQLPGDDEPVLSLALSVAEVTAEGPEAYSRRNLELHTADFYASIRKPESEWKSIEDLAPQLAEFEHRIRAGEYDDACRVLEPIDSDYLRRWGHSRRLFELRKRLLGRLTDLTLRAANLSSLGNVCYSLGRFDRAIDYHEQALAITRQIGDRVREARHLSDLGRAHRVMGQVEESIGLFEQAVVIARQVGNRQGERVALADLGSAYRATGQFNEAIRHYEEALEIARQMGDHREEGIHCANLGSAYHYLGQIEKAIEHYEQALPILHDIDDLQEKGDILGNLGLAYLALGRVGNAIESNKAALDISRDIGSRQEEGVQLCNLADAYYAQGRTEQAREYYEKALSVAREIGYRAGEGRYLGSLGNAYRTMGQVGRVIECYDEALKIAREIDDLQGKSYRLKDWGRALLITGEFAEAHRRCKEALNLNVAATRYQAALTLGIVLLHQRDAAAGETFADAAARSLALLEKTAGLYEPRYALAAALLGQAVCDPRWAEEGERAGLLAPALTEYERALETCAALGIVRDALQDLELIRAAGIEGLEPVFDLLADYAGEGTDGEHDR